jgi:bleomycin hydrolase
MWVVKNYGLVPEEVYNGRPRGEVKHNHMELDTVLNRFVKSCVQHGITVLGQDQRKMIDSVLDHYLGTVPKEFTYAGRKFTPQSFARDYLEINPGDFVEITSYTHHPFYEKFVLEDKYNWTGDAYYNVPLEDFVRITDHALQNGSTVGWDGDADDLFFDFSAGVAYMPGIISNMQQARQAAFKDSSTLLNHMMHIVGITIDSSGRKWYYIKNSWGDTFNNLGGFIFMRDDYFQMRTVAIIVNKRAIPDDIRRKMMHEN